MRSRTQSHDVRAVPDRFVVGVTSFMIERDVNGHRVLLSKLQSLGLLLERPFRGVRGFERKEGLVNSRPDLVHSGLQVVEIFVQTGMDDFIDAGERKIGTKLPE